MDAPKTKPKPKSKATARYYDPNTGKTWNGKGEPPAWIGENKNEFLIPAEGLLREMAKANELTERTV